MGKISDKDFYVELKSRFDNLDKKEKDLLSQIGKVRSDREAIKILLNGHDPTNAPSIQEKVLKKDDFNRWPDYIFEVFKKLGSTGTTHPVVEYILEAQPDFRKEYVRKAVTNGMIKLVEEGKLAVSKEGKSKKSVYSLIYYNVKVITE